MILKLSIMLSSQKRGFIYLFLLSTLLGTSYASSVLVDEQVSKTRESSLSLAYTFGDQEFSDLSFQGTGGITEKLALDLSVSENQTLGGKTKVKSLGFNFIFSNHWTAAAYFIDRSEPDGLESKGFGFSTGKSWKGPLGKDRWTSLNLVLESNSFRQFLQEGVVTNLIEFKQTFLGINIAQDISPAVTLSFSLGQFIYDDNSTFIESTRSSADFSLLNGVQGLDSFSTSFSVFIYPSDDWELSATLTNSTSEVSEISSTNTDWSVSYWLNDSWQLNSTLTLFSAGEDSLKFIRLGASYLF